MKGLKISGNRLISIVLSIVMCAMILTGGIWALSNLFKTGMSIVVTYDAPVDAKVYLSTDSIGAKDAGLRQPGSDNIVTVHNFKKENSALVLNTHDTDNNGGKVKGTFEDLGKGGSSLICDANGEMQFYVYVENYSETDDIYYRADITFGNTEETTPFSEAENPRYAVSEAVSGSTGGGVTSSLLSFKIALNDEFEGDSETNIRADQIKIEINLQTVPDIFWLIGEPLETFSWIQIQQISEAGVASQFFKEGDEKTVLINAVPYTFVILGFDHDDKFDGSGKAGITFGMKNLLASTYKMNNSDTNSTGWENCLMRTSTMVNLLTQLPSDLQSAIKTVNKEATKGGGSSATQTSQDKLFLFSEREIDGTGGTGGTTGYGGEGTQYDYYVSNPSRVKKLSGSTNFWWLRSPNVSNHHSFQYFNSGGLIGNYYASYAGGVCFGFCV